MHLQLRSVHLQSCMESTASLARVIPMIYGGWPKVTLNLGQKPTPWLCIKTKNPLTPYKKIELRQVSDVAFPVSYPCNTHKLQSTWENREIYHFDLSMRLLRYEPDVEA